MILTSLVWLTFLYGTVSLARDSYRLFSSVSKRLRN